MSEHQEQLQEELQGILAELFPSNKAASLEQILTTPLDSLCSELTPLVSLLHSPVVTIATQSSRALVILCQIRPPLVEHLLKKTQQAGNQGPLLHSIPADSTIMIRYYALVAKIIPAAHLAKYVHSQSQLFQPFLKGLGDDKDPLLQLSLLEILEQAGEEFVRNEAWGDTDVDAILQAMIGYGSDGSSGGALHPFGAGAALRILAVRESSPERFVRMITKFAREMSGEVEKIGFVDGLATFCHTDERLGILLNGSDTSNEILTQWLNFLRGGQSKFKAVVMNSIAKVLRCKSLSHDLRLRLFKAIGPVNDVGGTGDDSVHMIMEYVKSQIVEVRFGAYDLLSAIAGVEMGSHLLMRYGGFFEFCCNRNLEELKEGKDLKFRLVEAVYQSDVKGLLSDEVVNVLKQVVQDGPYYVKGTNRDVSLN